PRNSILREAGDSIRSTHLRLPEAVLSDHNVERAWQAYTQNRRDISSVELASLMSVNLPVKDDETRVDVTMDDMIGLVRGTFEDQ
ncbi:hypothetical protein, partial [Neokomagataea thailandica]